MAVGILGALPTSVLAQENNPFGTPQASRQAAAADIPLGPESEEQITLALENADIKELVRWAAEHTQKNIIIHPDVKGQVTVISGAPLSREEAYETFLSTLQAYGYAVISSGRALEVVPSDVANQSGAALLINGKKQGVQDDDVVVQIFKVNNISAAQLATLLKPMLPNSALLTPYPDSNMLLVSARAKQIERLRTIIAKLDQSSGVEVEMLPLQFARAKDVMQILTSLLSKGGNSSSTASGMNFTLAVDDRSNSLLMSGDPTMRQQVRTLIERLDRPKSSDSNTQVINVKFSSAESLAPLLMGVASSFLKADKDQASANIDTKIEVSKENNALVVTAPPTLMENIKAVINRLDVRRPQVIVEALIVEVNEDVANNIGVQWLSDVPSSSGIFAGTNTLPNGLITPTPPGLGSGLTLGFYNSGDLRGLVRALKTNTAANLLSTPTIVALDNEPAQILVGSNVPFVTGQSTGAASSTNNPFQTIERKDIGITLKVKPRINDDSSITMDVDQTVESIAPSITNTADIVTNKRNISTRVLIENDQVLVLGGLIQNDVNDTQAKVPLLGDMPVVGRLFRNTNTSVTKKNLMVFIHPRILASNSEGTQYSLGRYQGLRDQQWQTNRKVDRIFIPQTLPVLPDKTGSADSPTTSAPSSTLIPTP